MSVHPPAAPGWRRRLDTLRTKLFLAIAGVNVVWVVAAYAVYSWSFDQGLFDYLNRADEARLTPVIHRLGEGWRSQGNWHWISDDRDRWFALLREELGLRGGRRAASAASDAAPPPESPASVQPPPLTIDPRLLLFDADRVLLIGPNERTGNAVRPNERTGAAVRPNDRTGNAVLKPIAVDGRTVGYLGYVPRTQIVASLEQAFSAEQNRRFAAIALGMLLAVLLSAALIARWLARRLAPLGAAAAAVARGDYGLRLPVQGHDELAQLADDFNHMAASLQAARRSRQQWIADIAHELRTPLATLRAEIEALQDGVRRPDVQHLGSLAHEVSRLTRLVEDLRLLSLADLGALDYRPEPLDLGELVADHLADARRHWPEGLSLSTDLTPGLRVQADADRLTQVLNNLLQNTLRYTTLPGRLHLQLRRDGRDAHLVWEDSPPGVPADALPLLTERLYRVDASRARSSGGSGLGLAIAQAIVEGHGGRMLPTRSELGGLRWDIRVPLTDGERLG